MLKQIEGSRAVAEAVALCRPEVICAYPITPQTHIVEGLGEMVKAGELASCEFINVESEFAALSVAIGASAAGARTYTATSEPGPAVHGRGRLQRRGARPADRDDDRQPRDRRADQHLERSFRQHVDARRRLDPALRGDQPGSARPAHPGVPARRGAVVPGDGVHGRLHPHARVRSRRHARRRREVDAYLPPYEPRAGARSGRSGVASARWSAPRRSPKCATCSTTSSCARSSCIPQLAAEFETAVRPRFRRPHPHATACEDAETIVVALGSVNGTIQEVVDEMRDGGRPHRLGVDLLVPAVSARRAARSAAAREARRRAREVPGRRPGRHRVRRRAQVAVGHRAQRLHGHRRARRARDHAARR